MEEKIVSVIVPVYNAEPYLEKCFESILNQGVDNIEILAVNDGSKDNSQAVLEEYQRKYPSVFRIFEQENAGQGAARNLAIREAKGKYVTFLDADDYFDRDYISTLLSAAERTGSDAVISGQKKVDDDGKLISLIRYSVNEFPDTTNRRLNMSGKMYRLEHLRKNHVVFPEHKIYEDNPFNLHAIFSTEKYVILQYEGYNQLVHKGSTTTRTITSDMIPYRSLEKVIRSVVNGKHSKKNSQIFEYTILSFFTYFVFQALKTHSYMKSEHSRRSSMDTVYEFCDYAQRILKKYFPEYYKNPHLGLLKKEDLPKVQRVGTKAFVILCRTRLLKAFVKVYYSLT